MATKHGARRTRSISELQRSAPEIIREASKDGEVEIRRYGETVAYVVSPEALQRAHDIERGWERVVVALEYKRAMEDWEAGNVVEWEEFESELRRRFIDR